MRAFRKLFVMVWFLLVVVLATPHPVFSASSPEIPGIVDLTSQGSDAEARYVTGLYVSGEFTFPVVQQPPGQAGFVSEQPDVLTQFHLAQNNKVTGLLAHNTLAGAHFSALEVGQYLSVVHGDGSLVRYQITAVEHYQALQPTNPYSDFQNVNNPGSTLSVTQLFNHVYGQSGRLVLQTCISANDIPSWGRLFLIAEPVATWRQEPGVLHPEFRQTTTASYRAL